jgi:UDP-N-acetylmuramate dehydrogenase
MSVVSARTASRLDLLGLADVTVVADAALAVKTTLRVGGRAELFVEASTPSAVCEVMRRAGEQNVPLFVLGGGSNLLIADRGIPGIVLKLGVGLDYVCPQAAAGGVLLWEVGAAASTAQTLRLAVTQGLSGLEMLAGVPGLMGGALIMNAGGHDGSLESAVRNVRVVAGNEILTLSREAVGFTYRGSQFPVGAILLAAELELQPDDAQRVKARVQAATERRRASQPLGLPSAGSVFKNPAGDFAGRLIEAAGCKGWVEGGAEVSQKHANFIVNRGGATARDVTRLMCRVREAVLANAGARLELEVRLVGDFTGEELP